MSRMYWFRFYDEVLDDPKVQTLPPELFKLWVNTMCLANRYNNKLPSLKACSFALRETEDTVSKAFQVFANLRFIETNDETFQFSNWKKRQYKSDISTERVKKHREKLKRFKTVSETSPDTDTELNKKNLIKKSYPQPHVLSNDEAFEIFRDNFNPQKRGGVAKGRAAWDRAMERGDSPDEIIAVYEACKLLPDWQKGFDVGLVRFLDECEEWKLHARKISHPASTQQAKCKTCKTENATESNYTLCKKCADYERELHRSKSEQFKKNNPGFDVKRLLADAKLHSKQNPAGYIERFNKISTNVAGEEKTQ